jgi:hypothetical protein
MDEDTTLIELDTSTFDVFDLLALQLSQKLQALRTAAHHVQTLTPIAAGYLALYLGEVIDVATDLHTFLVAFSSSPSR